jgi:DUF4097 and DUF4098 domain-containing protein YvlB
MPDFPTTGPIRVLIDVLVADIAIEASDRPNVTVEVRPRRSTRPGDIRAVEATAVDFHDGQLTIRGPKSKLSWFGFGPGRDGIEITIAIPSASDVEIEAMAGTIRAAGRLGQCRLNSGMGGITIDDASALIAKTGMGDIVAGRVGGRVELVTGMGAVRIQAIDGPASIKSSFGDIDVDDVNGNLRVNTASGDIRIRVASGNVDARTAHGDIRLDQIRRGSIQVETAYGQLDIGIPDGTAAWLDAQTSYGRVRNDIPLHDGTAATDTTEIRARTSYGDITAHRAGPTKMHHGAR